MIFGSRRLGVMAGLAGLVLGIGAGCETVPGTEQALIGLVANNRANQLAAQGRFQDAQNARNLANFYNQLGRNANNMAAARASAPNITINVPPQQPVVYQGPIPNYSTPNSQLGYLSANLNAQPNISALTGNSSTLSPEVIERIFPQPTKVIDKRELMRGLYKKRSAELRYFESAELLVDFDGDGKVTPREIESSSRRNIFSQEDNLWVRVKVKNSDEKETLVMLMFCPVHIDSNGNIPFEGGPGPSWKLKPGEIKEDYVRVIKKAVGSSGDYCLMAIKVNTPENPGSDRGEVRYFSIE